MLPTTQILEALLGGITKAEIERLPPARRRRLAELLQHAADLCEEPSPSEPAARIRPAPRAGATSERKR